LPVGGVRQAGEDVTQVREGIETATAAAFDDGVEDGAAFAGFGLADEQPVLFAEGGWPDGVLHEVLIDLKVSIFEVNAKQRPQVERVVDGQPSPGTAPSHNPACFSGIIK